MSTCCARGYEKFFGARTARRDARKYRRKGLDGTAQRLVDEVSTRDVAGASVLEVGGGVGAIDLELFRRGAASALIVELSHGYDEEARPSPARREPSSESSGVTAISPRARPASTLPTSW